MSVPILNFILSLPHRIFGEKQHIIFYAPASFHAEHLRNVITALSDDQNKVLYLVGEFEAIKTKNILLFDCLKKLPLHINYDLYISSEAKYPRKISVKRVFFGHGVGPKLDYQGSSLLKKFDYSFSPCMPIYEQHIRLGIKARKIGLPILDDKNVAPTIKESMHTLFSLNPDKPTIVYAPSWHTNTKLLQLVPKIIEKLKSVETFNLIISPHPNLLKKALCNDQVLITKDEKNLNFPGSGITTLDICKVADITLSDISSVLFESMALGKRVVHDGNNAMYEVCGAAKILQDLHEVMPVLDVNSNIETQLTNALIQKDLPKTSEEFINNYMFNIGNSTKSFIKEMKEIIAHD